MRRMVAQEAPDEDFGARDAARGGRGGKERGTRSPRAGGRSRRASGRAVDGQGEEEDFYVERGYRGWQVCRPGIFARSMIRRMGPVLS